ncbi:hypothetical protein H4R34_001395 [Dimargaris verticillata]|uniref:HCP-like protein n=1 Tax=Dimargaris verticillata TaxID=2761393 RepID=A0A9W8EDU0_9FUNG|nr:hypothetical protein H4R34_001395 [Dimargaris verticillata]
MAANPPYPSSLQAHSHTDLASRRTDSGQFMEGPSSVTKGSDAPSHPVAAYRQSPALSPPPLPLPPRPSHSSDDRRSSESTHSHHNRQLPPLPPRPGKLDLDMDFQNLVLSPPMSTRGSPGDQHRSVNASVSTERLAASCTSSSSSTSSGERYTAMSPPPIHARPPETLSGPGAHFLHPTTAELYGTHYAANRSSHSLASSTSSRDLASQSSSVPTPSGQDQGFDDRYSMSPYGGASTARHPPSFTTGAPSAVPLGQPIMGGGGATSPPPMGKSYSHTSSPVGSPSAHSFQSTARSPPNDTLLPPPASNQLRLKNLNNSTPDLAATAASQQGFDGPIPRSKPLHYATMRGLPPRPNSSYYQMHSNSSGDLRPMSFADSSGFAYNRHSASTLSLQQSSARSSMIFGQRGSRMSVTLMSEKSALGMYREAAKKTNDPRIQFEFAKFLIQSVEDESGVLPISPSGSTPGSLAGSPHGSPRLGPQMSATEVMSQHETKQKLVSEAAYWVRLLEKQAYPEACFVAAEWYEEGKYGFPKDEDKAHAAYVVAAKHNVAYACYKIGTYYEKRKQGSKAMSYYQKGAALNDVSSNYRMALAHLRGELHQTKSVRQALIYLRRSSQPDEHCSEGAYLLALMYLDEFYECNVKDQIFKDFDEAQKLLERAAQFGNVDAQYRLGLAFEFGECGYEVDPVFSVSYYRMAAEQNHREAQMALSAWYLSGSPGTIDQNDELAFKWCSKSAEQGLVKAEFAMGYYHEVGIGASVDVAKAQEWYRLAIAHGSKEAQQRLDKLLGNGRENSRDLKRRVTKKRAKKDSSGCLIF